MFKSSKDRDLFIMLIFQILIVVMELIPSNYLSTAMKWDCVTVINSGLLGAYILEKILKNKNKE